ncbi:MAG: hypothetical protein Q9178_003653 [Gyalolechia marmorata]
MSKAGMYIKMAATFIILSVGGPVALFYFQPTDEELFKLFKHHSNYHSPTNQKYNPELQRKSLENREGRQQDFDNFVTKLKEYSKSDRPIWEAAARDEAQTRANSAEEQKKREAEMQKRREEIKRQALHGQ